MTKQVQRRRGTATQHTSFTGAEGEISVNTTNKSIHVHDGVTAGGIEGARADMTNVSDGDLNSRLAGNTLSSLTITSADINGGTIDGTVIGGSTPAAGSFTTGSFTGDVSFGDNDKAIFGAGSDLQIYHDGTHSYLLENGTGNLRINTDNQVQIRKHNNEAIAYFNADGAVQLYYDNSAKFSTTSTGIDVTGTVTADGLTVDAPNVTFSGVNFLLNLEDTNAGGSTGVRTKNSLGNETTRIAADDSNDLSFYTTSSVTKRMEIGGNGDITFYDSSGNASFVYDESAGSVFNQQGADRDFRVESDTNTHMLFVDAGTSKVGVGTGSPDVKLHVQDGTSGASGNTAGQLFVEGSTSAGISIGSATTNSSYIWFGDSDNIAQGRIRYDNQFDKFEFRAANVEDVLVLGGSAVVVNEESYDFDFRVESNVNTHALFVDGGNGRVGFGCSDVVDARVNIQSTGVDGTYDAVLSFQYSGNSNEVNQIGSSVSGTAANSGINFLVSDGAGSTVTRETLRLTRAAAVFNENGEDRDFRVESDTQTHMLFVDAGANGVGINASSIGSSHSFNTTLDIRTVTGTSGVGTGDGIFIGNTSNNIEKHIMFGNSSSVPKAVITTAPSGTYGRKHLDFHTNSTADNTSDIDWANPAFRIQNNSNIIGYYGATFNEAGGDKDFRVESENNANMLRVDAEHDAVVVGSSGVSLLQDPDFAVFGFGVKSFGINSNTVTDTGISLNQDAAGMACMVLASNHYSVGTSTRAAQYFLQFYYSGNNAPAVTQVAGTSGLVTFGVSASNTLTVQMPAGGNVISFLMSG